MALSSPGVQVTIIDESQYLPAAPNSIPLVILATAQNKINAAGTGVATATTKANAGKLYQVTSQRDLITYFGNPFFYKTTNGTSIHGYELNEYGLLAAYSVLGSTNLIYAIRADIDLAALVGKTGRPSSPPDNGSWWLDTDTTTWGIFEFNKETGVFTNQKPRIITTTSDLQTDGVTPKDTIAPIGSYAVNLAGDPSAAPHIYYTYWYRGSDGWVSLGSQDWKKTWPTIQGTTSNPTISSAGNLIVTRGIETANFTGVINDGKNIGIEGNTLTITKINSSSSVLGVGTVLSGSGIIDGTYITSQLTGTSGGVGTYTVSESQAISTSKKTFTGSISGTTLTVTDGSGLAVGQVLSGSSSIAIDAATLGGDYAVGSIGDTDFSKTVIDLTGGKTLADFGISTFPAMLANGTSTTTMVVNTWDTATVTGPAWTDGTTTTVTGGLLAGRSLSLNSGATTTSTGGTSIIKQTHYLVGKATFSSGGAVGATTVTMTGAKAADGTSALSWATLSALAGAKGLVMVGSGLPKEQAATLAKVTTVATGVITLDTAFTTQAGAGGVYGTDYYFYAPVTTAVTTTATGTVGTNSLTLTSTTGISVGDLVSGTGIIGGTYVETITNGVITLTSDGSDSLLQTQGSGTYTFYKAVDDNGISVYGSGGIYKISALSIATGATVTAQPTIGTKFKLISTATIAASPSGATLTRDVTPGTYISALGTGTGGIGTYTVSASQTITSSVLSAYSSTISGVYGKIVTVTTTDTAESIAAKIDALVIPYITAKGDSTVSNKLSLYYSLPDTTTFSAKLGIAGDSSVLSDLGLPAGVYATPGLEFANNANQPTWRKTDATPHPTGSVWIKTNAFNEGLNVVLSQYSSASASFTSKTVTARANDFVANDALDSTGGQAIPLNTVLLQPSYGGRGPMRMYYRAATGASTFTGTVADPTGFAPSSSFTVQVSTPGSAVTSSAYTVTIPAGLTQASTTASDFIDAWHAATLNGVTSAIPYTEVSTDANTGAITITHTEGGIIVLDDSASVTAGLESPLTTAGITFYDMSSATGTLGAKHGQYKTVDYTEGTGSTANSPASTTGGAGTGLKVSVTSTGFVPTLDITTSGSGYSQDDIFTVDGITGLDGVAIEGKVVSLSTDGSGTPTVIEWYSGFAQPQYTVLLSNWEPFDFIADNTAPVNSPADGTPWFYSVINQVDLMINVGGVWKGYLNVAFDDNGLPRSGTNLGNNPSGPIIAAAKPITQTNGNKLVYGDIWIDSSDLENYPQMYRWQSVNSVDQWTKLDITDQTTENGVLFADARWGTSGDVDPVNDKMPTTLSMLKSDYTDLDAPNAAAYPQGMILFNTRRSGYNVKEFRVDYFNAIDFADQTLPTYKDAWVTMSGNKANGSPYMGRKAQRAVIVKALKSMVDSSSELRDDQTSYNLIVAPGYAELQPNMVSLNNDRNNTAYIIGDTPLRLQDDANAITAWAANSNGATGTGDDGLVTRDTYLGVYYPSGITTDLTGADVVVPPSHMMLRTMIHNDNVAYPWFAPAGMRRGVVDNVTNIGYIDAASGEFKTTQNRVALRDIEYTNFINPIAFFRNVGLLNYGNKNSYDSQSALDRTNVARLICYIRDRLQVAVRPFLFEPNDTRTRDQVKAVILTLMADIKTKRGIYDYLVVCDESNNTPARIDRNELWIDIAIEPVKAIEFIYIPVRVLNTGEIAKLG